MAASHSLRIVAAALLASAALAQTPVPPDPSIEPQSDQRTPSGTVGEPTGQSPRPEHWPPPVTPDRSPVPPPTEVDPTQPPTDRPADRDGTSSDRTGDSESVRIAAAGSAIDRHRATKVLGTSIETLAGETIGVVEDVILDRSGKATHAIASLGAASSLTAIPWERVVAAMRDGRIVMDRARLEGAPGFTQSNLPDFSVPSWSQQADRYWNSAPATTRGIESAPAQTESRG